MFPIQKLFGESKVCMCVLCACVLCAVCVCACVGNQSIHRLFRDIESWPVYMILWDWKCWGLIMIKILNWQTYSVVKWHTIELTHLFIVQSTLEWIACIKMLLTWIELIYFPNSVAYRHFDWLFIIKMKGLSPLTLNVQSPPTLLIIQPFIFMTFSISRKRNWKRMRDFHAVSIVHP